MSNSHHGPESSWLSCFSHGYNFVISIADIAHVVPTPDVTPVLGVSNKIAGAAIYRGKVIPVVDIGMVFGMERDIAPVTSSSLVVLHHEGQYVGIRVDACAHIIYFALSNISQSKEWIHPAWQPLVQGLYQHHDVCHVVLDTSRLIAAAIDDTKALYQNHVRKEGS